MIKFKIFITSLGLLLSLVTIASDKSITNDYESSKSSLKGKTHTARVISPKAIVYSDENMLTPIGYIANGKSIIVGNPRKLNKDLVPLVISGRIAFIETKDLRFEDTEDDDYNAKRGAPREHDFDIIIQKPEERLSENNSVYFTLHRYGAGNETKDAFVAIDRTEESTFSGFHIQFIHRQSASRYFWGAGIDYSSISTENMRFGYWMFSPTVGYTPLKNSLFLVDFYASLDLATNVELVIDSNFDNEPTGYVWGAQANSRIVFFPERKYHLFGGIGLRKYNVSGFTTLQDTNAKNVTGITSISGISLFAGLSIEF